jgi:threonine dehydrogenase-like Zn-dependent dehydrogenase
MKAVVLPGSRQVEVVERPDPVPGPGEVLVRVRSSALCRSDMSLYDGTPIVGGSVAGTGSIVPGHESAGEIAGLGPGVTGVREGDRVAIDLAIGCGRCRWCLRGYRMLCRDWKCVGFDVDGGDAELIVVPAVNAMPIPDGMSFDAAAVSTDMVGTQYSTQKRLGVSGADTVAVSGIGPMGAAGILVARARGARVIAIDMLDSRLEIARSLGADEVVDARAGDTVERLRELTGGEGVDVGIECSGSPAAQNTLLDAARRLGSVAFVGESRETTIKPSDQLIRKILTVIGAWYFASWEYPEIAAFIMGHELPVERIITHRFRLDEAGDAFRMFHARETEKAVFAADA